MDAKTFCLLLHRAMRQHRPSGRSTEWTLGMERVFGRMARLSSMSLRCQRLGGEFGRIDYAFSTADGLYPRLEVAIEHENAWSVTEATRDFHKLCTVAAPLRVMFCYRSTKDEAHDTCNALMSLFEAQAYHELPRSETLILAGWNQATSASFDWHRFCRRGGRWRQLHLS